MNHIEFIGPPGAGKSTIHKAMLSDDRLFGGVTEDAIERAFLENSGLHHRLVYRAMPSKPKNVQALYRNRFLRYSFENGAFEEFVERYPKFIRILAIAMERTDHQPVKLFRLCKTTAEEYQLGISTVRDQEVLCLDEGFSERAASILWRTETRTFPLDEYFETVPTPRLLIHIDAPRDLCLKRQHERGRVHAVEDWTGDARRAQASLQDSCYTVSDYATSIDIPVVTVENTGTIKDAVSELKRKIREVDIASLREDKR